MPRRITVSQRYRAKCKFKKSNTTYYADTQKEVFEAANVFLDSFSTKAFRTGSLKADGVVKMWEFGDVVGSVTVEEYVDGQYQQYGG